MAKGVGLHQLMSKCDKIDRELKSLRGLINKIQDLPDDSEKDNVQEFIAFYCDRWTERYKHTPKLDGKSVGALRTFLKDHKAEKAKAMVTAYLKMNDAFFIRKRHDPATLISNSLAIGHFADSKQVITADDARQTERTYKAQSLFDMVDEGKL